ncbi:hypothetical protein KCP69_14420 [Salmonella enterica subsp. enterica]|nr:hypothetical protein KCP69_14420 [Salmonella enterica subsp. enterica]
MTPRPASIASHQRDVWPTTYLHARMCLRLTVWIRALETSGISPVYAGRGAGIPLAPA